MLTLCAKFCMLKAKKDHKKCTSVLPFNGHLELNGNQKRKKKLCKEYYPKCFMIFLYMAPKLCFQQKKKTERRKN